MNLYDELHFIEHLMAAGKIPVATNMLQQLSNEFPENYYVTSMLGECYLHCGKPELAVKPLLWATKRFPERDRDFHRKFRGEQAMIEKLRGYFSELDVWFDYYLLGCAYARLAKFQHAMQSLNIANRINPDNTEILRNMGWIRCMQQKKRSGRYLLRRAIRLDPENALAYNDLGASYLFDERFSDAKKWIKKAQTMDPNDRFIKNTAEKLEEFLAHKTIEKKMRKR